MEPKNTKIRVNVLNGQNIATHCGNAGYDPDDFQENPHNQTMRACGVCLVKA